MLLLFSIRVAELPLFGKEQFIWFPVLCVNFSVCLSFPFVFEGTMWDLTVLIPDHCLPIYFPVPIVDYGAVT